ncbi:MAG: hypothetical protein HY804_09485 [Nitrospinae bacterium]|nr:hypothetical protein [Nitrospinota bacterium]
MKGYEVWPVFWAVIAAMAFFAQPAAAQNPWEGFPEPPDSTVKTVADRIVHNGVPQSIRVFSSEADVESVVRFYLSVWAADGPAKPIESQIADYRVVTRVAGNYAMTVQAQPKPDGGSFGYLSVIMFDDMAAALPPPGHGLPAPDGSVTLSDIESDDGPKQGRTVMLRNSHSVDYNARYYISSLRFQGWKLVDQKAPMKKDKSRLLTFRRSAEEVNVVISDKVSQTTVLLNFVSVR